MISQKFNNGYVCNCDCIEVMKTMQESGKTVDLTITSPPYDDLRTYDNAEAWTFDKFKEMHLTPLPASIVKAPLIGESPMNLECRVTDVKELGSHDMFIAEVVAVHADEKYMDENHKFHLEKADPITYSHGTYYTLGENLGTFGFSVRKK